MAKIELRTADGGESVLDGPAGRTLMEVLRDAEASEEIGLCGGVASCATCHVYVETNDELPELDEDEEDVLSSIDARQQTSRLSCQVLLRDDMAPIRVVMPEDEW